MEEKPQAWFFVIDGEYSKICEILHYSVNDFVFPCINRQMPRDSLSPNNLYFVKDGNIHWTPLKQKLFTNFHLKQNIVVYQYSNGCYDGCFFAMDAGQRFQGHKESLNPSNSIKSHT